MSERIEVVVSGQVQMVMYRDFTCRNARKLGLLGEVKNLPDSTVYVIAEGPRAQLEKLLSRLKTGPLLSDVEEVEVEWLSAQHRHKNFSISY
jgi:acylphosphatase